VTALIEVESLDAGYGDLRVVTDLSLTVEPGKIVALIGANGAGKTTTVLTVCSLLPPLKGRIRYLGESTVSPRRAYRHVQRGLGIVPDDRGLFRRLTVSEHIKLAAGRRWRAGQSEVLKYLPELEPLLGRKVGVLSGGEQQMVALARALALQPKAIVIDEMSLGLAPLIATRLGAAVRELASAEGIGVLLVEQHTNLALSVADSLVVLERGRTVFAGAPADLDQSGTLLEKAYLGTDSPNHPTTSHGRPTELAGDTPNIRER
jgi:branched-chain amino acid transport system ATP-binding protein